MEVPGPGGRFNHYLPGMLAVSATRPAPSSMRFTDKPSEAALASGLVMAAVETREQQQDRGARSNAALSARMAMHRTLLKTLEQLLGPLTGDLLLKSYHAITGATPAWRDGIAFFGGSGRPSQAIWVAPPSACIRSYIDNFIEATESTAEASPEVLAAIHLQWTSVHPLPDGNGRMARLLIARHAFRASGSLLDAATWLYVLANRRHSIAKAQRLARSGQDAALRSCWHELAYSSQVIRQAMSALLRQDAGAASGHIDFLCWTHAWLPAGWLPGESPPVAELLRVHQLSFTGFDDQLTSERGRALRYCARAALNMARAKDDG